MNAAAHCTGYKLCADIRVLQRSGELALANSSRITLSAVTEAVWIGRRPAGAALRDERPQPVVVVREEHLVLTLVRVRLLAQRGDSRLAAHSCLLRPKPTSHLLS